MCKKNTKTDHNKKKNFQSGTFYINMSISQELEIAMSKSKDGKFLPIALKN